MGVGLPELLVILGLLFFMLLGIAAVVGLIVFLQRLPGKAGNSARPDDPKGNPRS